MYLITGGVGFLACVIFIILIIAAAMRGKPCVVPLVAFVLALALFLGSGFLYSRTDPEVGGVKFLEFITKDKTVPPNPRSPAARPASTLCPPRTSQG